MLVKLEKHGREIEKGHPIMDELSKKFGLVHKEIVFGSLSRDQVEEHLYAPSGECVTEVEELVKFYIIAFGDDDSIIGVLGVAYCGCSVLVGVVDNQDGMGVDSAMVDFALSSGCKDAWKPCEIWLEFGENSWREYIRREHVGGFWRKMEELHGMKYVSTTHIYSVPTDKQVVMIGASVPGWTPKALDLQYDHNHLFRTIGTRMVSPSRACVFVATNPSLTNCVAGAWLQLSPFQRERNRDRLESIASISDLGCLPDRLAHLSAFAFAAVDALEGMSGQIIVDLDLDFMSYGWSEAEKERYGAEAFRRRTEWILSACAGDPWPGEPQRNH